MSYNEIKITNKKIISVYISPKPVNRWTNKHIFEEKGKPKFKPKFFPHPKKIEPYFLWLKCNPRPYIFKWTSYTHHDIPTQEQTGDNPRFK
jgi:hypothetical protein